MVGVNCKLYLLVIQVANILEMLTRTVCFADGLFICFFNFFLSCFISALVKSMGLRTDGRIDDRSFWISYVSSISTALAIPLVYPRMMAIHELMLKVCIGFVNVYWIFFNDPNIRGAALPN